MINISTYIIIYIPVIHRLFISNLYTSFMYMCLYLHSGSNVTQPEALKTSILYKPKGSGVLYHQSETLHGHWTSAQTTVSDAAIESPLAPRVLGFTCNV